MIYIICLVLLGLPAMINEFSLGRAAHTSPLKMLSTVSGKKKADAYGLVALIGNVSLMAFYTVVTGWMLNYFIKFLTGQNASVSFGAMLSSPAENVLYMGIIIVLGFLVLSFRIQGGLEKVIKIIMPLLFVLLTVLSVRSFFLPGAAEGLSFYLIPDFTKINLDVIVAAMTQAFMSLSLGIGSMAIFGSYSKKEHSLMGESISIISMDTLVALMAGLIIFPACFTYKDQVSLGAGPSLLFDSMATVFNNMNGGRWWGALFFLFMLFAAFSTVLAVFENILAMVREYTGWKRPLASVICGAGIFLLSLTTAFGYNIWSGFHPFNDPGKTFLDLWDFIVSTNLLPLGSIFLLLFTASKKFGWGWENMMAEANMGKGPKIKKWMKPLFCYIAPIAGLLVYITGMISFFTGA